MPRRVLLPRAPASRRSRAARRPLARALAAVVVTAAAVTVAVMTNATAGGDRCSMHRDDARLRAALVTGTGADVLVIGDSYAVGLGVTPEVSWPTRLSGRIRVAGFSGSGFSRAASACGDRSYATRAPGGLGSDPALVVVEGGLNDTDQPVAAVVTGFARLMKALVGHPVVVVGPPPAPARVAGVPAVDGLLSDLSAAYDVPYLSLVDRSFPYLPDRLHLTEAGHREFGDAVAGWLDGLRVPVLASPASPAVHS